MVPSSMGFNGAVDERRRRAPSAERLLLIEVSFNGAVDERRRRVPERIGPARGALASMGPSTNVDGENHWQLAVDVHARLQWGRRRTSTERPQRQATPGDALVASMGPSTNVDGETRPRDHEVGDARASMGPSTNVDGEVRRASDPRDVLDASMGPSTNVDGEGTSRSCRSTAGSRFNGAVDERRRRAADPTIPRQSGERASMGPSTNVDGETRVTVSPRRSIGASMGPSTNVDGENPSAAGLDGGVWLQWGRRRTSTESLTWHDFLAGSARFNGAVDERRRRDGCSPFGASAGWGLQWGRRRTSTERLRGS